MRIHCCNCKTDVDAVLVSGDFAYPHRPDLFSLPFWKCDSCQMFVGCHYKTDNPLRPLGVIPSPEIKKKRSFIHALIDPIWQKGRMGRSDVYSELSKDLGYPYHTAEIRTVEQAEQAIDSIKKLREAVGLINI